MNFDLFFLTKDSPFSLSLFSECWNSVISRHAILRTQFWYNQKNKKWFQVVHKKPRKLEEIWENFDWKSRKGNPNEIMTEFLENDRKRSFEISWKGKEWPLMRFTLVQLEDNVYHFIWTHHHVCFSVVSLIKFYNFFSKKKTKT